MSQEEATVRIEPLIVQETDSAYLLDVGADEDVWVPKSLTSHVTNLSEDIEGYPYVEMVIPEWLAVEKGIV